MGVQALDSCSTDWASESKGEAFEEVLQQFEEGEEIPVAGGAWPDEDATSILDD